MLTAGTGVIEAWKQKKKTQPSTQTDSQQNTHINTTNRHIQITDDKQRTDSGRQTNNRHTTRHNNTDTQSNTTKKIPINQTTPCNQHKSINMSNM